MEILLISKSRGTSGRIRLNVFALAVFGLLALGAAAVTIHWGYVRGSDDMAVMILDNPERFAQLWQREIVRQRQFLTRLEYDLDADLSELSSSVGKLMGSLGRLDAIAERVVTSSSLDPKEFALGADVPLGGPYPDASELPEWGVLLANLSALKTELELRDSRLSVLESFLLDREQLSKTKPDGRPVDDGWISSGYGYRTHPVSGRREMHSGIDFAGKPGLDVNAVADGIVTWSGKRWGYGNLVELNHGNGYVTRYAHNRVNLVTLGEKVTKNQAIALLGNTGQSTGPHVHFEVVHNNRSVNPWNFIRQHAE